MVLDIPEGGVVLENSAKTMAELPAQAFALTLSGSVIEDMIACVQSGGEIQLSLGSSPKFLFDDHEIRISKTPDPSGYDLFWASSETPSTVSKLPNPTMSIFRVPKLKAKPKAPKAPGPGAKGSESAAKRVLARSAASPRDSDSQAKMDPATAQLERSLDILAANKRENSASGSPSFPGSGPTAQERLKQQRFPILHELAVQELSREELLAKWHEGTEEEFNAVLDKVADLDKDTQKWALKKMFWKELDVFEYNYASKEDRQRAINNAIKQYDRSRLGTSDPLWQKLLPKADRGKGICLSRLQAAIAKGPPPPAPKQRAGTADASGAESDSGSLAKGGESMSRSSSQASTGKKKLSASEAQAKRMLSTSKKPVAAVAAKPVAKAMPAKAATKGAGAKGGRVLSKEFVTDSSSSDDEVPLSTSLGKSKAGVVPSSKPAARAAEKPKPAEKTKEAPAAKPKAAAVAKAPPREDKKEKEKDKDNEKEQEKEKEKERERDTIRAQVIAKPIKPPIKRSRDPDDDDSSSSGTPLSKRAKPVVKPPAARSSSGPPPPAKVRDREQERETTVRSVSSNTDSGTSASIARKRPPTESLPGNKAKRSRPSQETIEMAARFKQFYARYEQLHHDISKHDNPDPSKVMDLLDMHERLSRMKTEIYAAVEAC
ncbi:a04405fe-2379-4695-81d2-8dcb0bf0b553 [Thermothielavioides terrestris]|uniref:A04405fe-2379-4695-81d2-8dcb0bf0b553 n=1 Tax=Thermothielavioides terrestris TaxID=2587410 RepID=A0A446B6A6_9PEZI|nr:a04405fe-2379-4695-81d2-8dcb0bf0b553 [Thermothielavioides terrestris]